MCTLDAAPTVVILMSERPLLCERAKRKDGGKRQSAELHGLCILWQKQADWRSADVSSAVANDACGKVYSIERVRRVRGNPNRGAPSPRGQGRPPNQP